MKGVVLLSMSAATVALLYLSDAATAQSRPATPLNLRIETREATPETAAWNRTNGPPLDLSRYSIVWADEFDSRRILPGNESGFTNWFAGAQGGPYGAANVGYSPRSDVYLVSNGVLTIRAHANVDGAGRRTGTWYSGHLQTVNTRGEGFAIQEGYFEARMKFPRSMGAWPSFWLKHRDKWLIPTATNIEIDVVEWYGGDWNGHHHTVHVGEGPARKYWSDYENVRDPNGAPLDLSRDWHTHGALVTRDWIVIYLDRVEIGRFPVLAPLRTPLYPQVTLSILKQGGAVSPEAVSPMDLQVDYVRVYAPNQR